MERISRTILKVEIDYDFDLFALVTPLKGHRLCWLMNEALNFNFAREKDLEINHAQEKKVVSFSMYTSNDELSRTIFTLVANKQAGAVLIPELKEADFFLKVQGTCDKQSLMDGIRKHLDVQTVFDVDPDKLRSKENLIFD